MDSRTPQAQDQSKDFMSFFPPDLAMEQLQASTEQFQFSSPQQSATAVNMDLLGTIGSMINEQTTAAAYNPGMLIEQQYKVQQLQQLQSLQNQIFQQQIAILSSSPSSPLPVEAEGMRDRGVPFHGLPTPGNSTELRAQTSVEYVSPMILDYNDPYGTPQPQHHLPSAQYNAPPRGSTSAPAHIAFHTNQPELDFDISPLTSPWLGAHQHPVRHEAPQGIKRRATSSSDDEGAGKSSDRPSRKKQSPAIRATIPIPKKGSRSKSASSTPLLRSTRTRKESISMPGDTPSPVDLSMPPPAPPDSIAFVQQQASTSTQSSPALRPQLTPVTPASIMNLGRLGVASNLGGKSKKSPVTASSPKNALPGTSTLGGPVSRQMTGMPPRKTSHKAAEQKRRDSLKTTFDELRTLLPPIALPSDVADEPVLPGALPPRGPPKAGAEGPNKGVSKLQLLICGNDYIRTLSGRVQRRDDEIASLRREVGYLRGVTRGEFVSNGEVEENDLEHDLDACEYGIMLGRMSNTVIEEDDEDEE